MIAGVIGLAGLLFDHDPFRITRSARQLRIHIILAIVPLREVSLTVVKCASADVSGKWLALAIL
jgi:hypothetical protein